MSGVKELSFEDYTVGWICALPLEMAAAKAMLDETHAPLQQRPGDDNSYTMGEIFGHNIVLACLPAGIYGTTSANAVAVNMLSTYRQIRLGLMVGIGGGVPSKTNDIRLGDIVVSRPSGSFGGGVVQYDYGKTVHGGEFEHTGTLDKPPQVLLTALSNVQSNEMLGKSRINEFLAEIPVKYPALSRFTYPHGETDLLYQAEYDHPDQSLSCDECKCDKDMVVQRATRPSRDPRVFYGLITSGNQVLKHGLTRDQLAAKHGMICFEMEASGLMDHFPCLVIRGITRLCRLARDQAVAGVCRCHCRSVCKGNSLGNLGRCHS
jgi:nucleoside phosphorylase